MSIKSMAEENLATMIDSVAEELTSNNLNKAVITEDFFVKVFLPMFAGDAEFSKKVTPDMWFNISHGPFNEVGVYDAQGQHLFDVPAYAAQSAVNPLDGSGKDANMQTVSDMIQTARMYANRGSGVVEGFILHEMDKRSFMFNKDVDNSVTIDRWNAIFQRYNLKPIPTTTSSLTANAIDPTRDSSEFDPL